MKWLGIAFCVVAYKFCCVSCETWVSRGRLFQPNLFFRDLMQEVTLELERREWCNLRVDNVVVNINDQMYNWHVRGNATYTNGFVTSIQNIDLSNIESSLIGRVANNLTQAFGTVNGRLNLRDVEMGFDVLFHLNDGSSQRFTGLLLYTIMQLQVMVTKNFYTKEITVDTTLTSLRAGWPRMIYMPANNTTEVLSRRFTPSSIMNSVSRWGTQIIQPIVLNLFRNKKIEFPSVCFVNC